MKALIDSGPSGRGWHRLESFLRCPQLFAWGYGQAGSNPKRASAFGATYPLVRGSIGHVGLAHCYANLQWTQQGGALDDSPFYMPMEAMQIVSEKFGSLGVDALPVAARAVKGYAHRYGSEPFTVLAVEEAIETEFLGHRYTARIDLVIEDRGGKVWIIDHKFVSRIDSKVARRYTLSGQFLGLTHIGFRTYGGRFGGVRLNLIGCNVPGFERPSLDSAPWMLAKFPSVVAHAEAGIARLEKMIAAGEEVPAAPSEHTCFGSYGECPAFDLCRWGEMIVPMGSGEAE